MLILFQVFKKCNKSSAIQNGVGRHNQLLTSHFVKQDQPTECITSKMTDSENVVLMHMFKYINTFCNFSKTNFRPKEFPKLFK